LALSNEPNRTNLKQNNPIWPNPFIPELMVGDCYHNIANLFLMVGDRMPGVEIDK
jgi:hypothetical protein